MYTKNLTLLFFLLLTLSQSWSQSSNAKAIALNGPKKKASSVDTLREADLSILDESQELDAKDPAKVESPIQNANEGNKKTTGLTQFELADDLSLDSDDVFVPPDFMCTPTKRTKVTRRRESGDEPHTTPNQCMALVHKA